MTQLQRQLGRYALFGEMAVGGMASVHLGRVVGSAGFSRTVVIKRMKAELAANKEFVEMFVDEARLASRVQHPNVVSTLDVVRDGKELFIVMEHVHGVSLDELIETAMKRGERIPPQVVSALCVQALLGLHAAHQATSDTGEPLELVHRDISPHNILVDVDGAARVVDFGVAKAAQKLHKTRDGQVKGKWAYMSPEQVAGEDLDRRSDIFAAGIVLWEALTCERLFFHENPARIATDITYKEVGPPSAHGAQSTAELDEVVLKALSKEPADRFATARDMAVALRRAQPPTDVLEVSAWLEGLAGDALAVRAQQVAAIEKQSASLVLVPESAAISLIDSGVADSVREAIEESRKDTHTLIGGTRALPQPDADAIALAREKQEVEPPDEVARVIEAHRKKEAERRSVGQMTAVPSTPKVTPDRVEPTLSEPPAAEPDPDDEEADVVAMGGAATLTSEPEQARAARRRVWVGVVILLLAAATLFVLVGGNNDKKERATPGPRTDGSGRSVLPRQTVAPAPVRSAAPRPADPTARAAPSPVAPSPAAVKQPRGVAPKTKPASNCDPNFTLRADGVKEFKPECF